MRLFLLLFVLFLPAFLFAQAGTAPSDETDWHDDRFWLTIQANIIRQQQPSFPAKYSGVNSLSADKEHASSRVETLYSGFRITQNLEFLFDLESAGGAGLSNALGVAGFTNVDVVRNPTLGEAPYVSRIMLHYTLPLSKDTEEAARNPLGLASRVPRRRLEFRLGKLSTVDFFDLNSVGSDSHLQFMNWAAVNNGAFDYAADTRGYTYGLVVEYYDKWWAARYGELLMPTVANGITLDWNIARAGGQNLEFEVHPEWIRHRQTVVRALSFLNRAAMGSYNEAIGQYLNGQAATPDITLSRRQGRVKYGFGLNAEQELTDSLRVFGRLGWNNGTTESYAYTEIDHTGEFGADLRGKLWKRPQDKIGAAFVINGISKQHAEYLALGGLGFILGDGGLRYGAEDIFEAYYTAHLWRGISFAGDVQHINNPGYNQDRGPALVSSIRLHFEDGFTSFHKKE
ncbi:MAG TPA: carbohydrate porin [Bryobacteraceae bacterium]|nr:carbohydrate porin [Bryobacteraceae bacterium]